MTPTTDPRDTVMRFDATIVDSGRGGGRVVEVPFDAREAFGETRPPVIGTVNGVEYRSRLAVYGGRTFLGLRRELRDAAGVGLGDRVEVELRRDDAPREVEVPPELERELAADTALRAAYDGLAYTHRREYAEWVAAAKRPETRERRTAQVLARLRGG